MMKNAGNHEHSFLYAWWRDDIIVSIIYIYRLGTDKNNGCSTQKRSFQILNKTEKMKTPKFIKLQG